MLNFKIIIAILILCLFVFATGVLAADVSQGSLSATVLATAQASTSNNPNIIPPDTGNNTLDANRILTFLVLGIILGAIGQGARAVIGIKNDQAQSNKSWDDWVKENFSTKTLMISLFIGGIAGGIAAITFVNKPITNELLLGLMAAGYAGADFIEGVMKSRLPSATAVSGGNLQASNPAVSKDYNHG